VCVDPPPLHVLIFVVVFYISENLIYCIIIWYSFVNVYYNIKMNKYTKQFIFSFTNNLKLCCL
jgi:hypothetical protein